MKASKLQAKGSEYFPAISFDPWQVYLTDDQGVVWVAEEDFATEAEADALIAKPFNPANYYRQGPSYALGQVDEYSLMDDEERAHYGY
jgi:hypothetical protein